jgi:hypothetical protein
MSLLTAAIRYYDDLREAMHPQYLKLAAGYNNGTPGILPIPPATRNRPGPVEWARFGSQR